MPEQTVTLHRVLTAPPAKVFRAFTTPEALARWLPPNGFTCTVFELDARVGGKHRAAFTNFSNGKGHSFGGEYLEVVPDQRLVYTDRFDDPGLSGCMTVTVSLTPAPVGTELRITQSGIPEQIPLTACYLGWQESLDNLKRLVEPVIPE